MLPGCVQGRTRKGGGGVFYCVAGGRPSSELDLKILLRGDLDLVSNEPEVFIRVPNILRSTLIQLSQDKFLVVVIPKCTFC